MTIANSLSLNTPWEFYRGDLGGLWEACRPVKQGDPEDALKWEMVTLPHCFNSFDCVNPHSTYYQGPGWYRRNLTLSNPFPGGRVLLHFEGAGQICDVYVDEDLVESHTGGYDEWFVDITGYADSRDHLLTVRCSNERDLEIIPSDLSDFNLYGGLYRSVNLVYHPAVHIESIRITACPDRNRNRGILQIEAPLNRREERIKGLLEIQAPSGKTVIQEPMESRDGRFLFNTVLEDTMLWSPDSPALYSCTITLASQEGSSQKSGAEYSECFGFRSFEFLKHGPFLLNGERLLLKGTHRHEDHAGVAAAMSDEQIEQEMRMIREMGANFIRLGHYQQSRKVLDLCDRLGILVWEEIPWCRGGLGGSDYKKMGREMLKNMINQHRNHPSVILWGLGNENDWPGDFSKFDEKKIREYMKELHNLSHITDSSRMTAIRRCDFCKDIPDVYSPSIWAGWYRGHYREYREATLKHISEVDHFLHVEWGAASHAGRFSEDPYEGLEDLKTGVGTDERGSDASLYGGIARVSKDGSWSENYACDLFDWTLKEQETMEELTGTAFWPFKDFSTPLRPENPVPYVNQKGVVQRDLTPKESFYVVQSFWSSKPMIRVFGHQWTDRWGDEGEVKEFRVYSNCSRIELFLNGKSLGVRERNSQNFPAAGLRWEAPLHEGEYSLKALALDEGLEDSLRFRYHSTPWGDPARLEGRVIRSSEDEAEIEVFLVDSEGRICLDSRDYVSYSLAGRGQLLKDLGTPGGSSKVQLCNGKSRIRARARKGEAHTAVDCPGLPPLFLEI